MCKKIKNDEILLGVGAGTGITAKSIEAGGQICSLFTTLVAIEWQDVVL